MTEIIKTNGGHNIVVDQKTVGFIPEVSEATDTFSKIEEGAYIGDDYGLGGNDESVYKSDFNYLTIDNYLDFPEVVKDLL